MNRIPVMNLVCQMSEMSGDESNTHTFSGDESNTPWRINRVNAMVRNVYQGETHTCTIIENHNGYG